MTPVIVGVVVAAGEATRMGEPKQVMPIGGKPMLQWVVDAAEASKLDRVVVVTGYAADAVRAGVRLGRGEWAHNPDPGRGTMSSLRVGIAKGGSCDAVMKLVSDQPEIETGVIDELIDRWDPAEFQVALVQYQDGPGHPFLFSAAAIHGLDGEEGDRLLWRFMETDPSRVHRLEWQRPRPVDVNGPDDYRLAAERLGYSSAGPPSA